MDSQHSQTTDPKTQEIITRMNRRDHRTEQIIRRILYILEHLIAVLSILALVAALCIEIYQMITTSGYFDDISNYLHNTVSGIGYKANIQCKSYSCSCKYNSCHQK